MFLKGELGPIFRPIEAVVGAFCTEGHYGFISGMNRLEFRCKKSFKIGHDLRAIDHDQPRSSVDHAPDSPELPIDDRGIDFT